MSKFKKIFRMTREDVVKGREYMSLDRSHNDDGYVYQYAAMLKGRSSANHDPFRETENAVCAGSVHAEAFVPDCDVDSVDLERLHEFELTGDDDITGVMPVPGGVLRFTTGADGCSLVMEFVPSKEGVTHAA